MSSKTHSHEVPTELELAQIGTGHLAYIKTMTSDEARQQFPAIEGIPDGVTLFSVFDARGTPIALTDTLRAAHGHAEEAELELVAIH